MVGAGEADFEENKNHLGRHLPQGGPCMLSRWGAFSPWGVGGRRLHLLSKEFRGPET